MARSTEFTYLVTVVNPGSGNKYYMNGILQQYITLFPGCTYEFDQSDGTNSTHNLAFATLPDAASSSQYTTGVTTSGTPGNSGAYAKIEVTTSTPYRLYFYCTNHSGMGNEITVQQAGGNTRAYYTGAYPSFSAQIGMTDMASSGSFFDFGDMSEARYAVGAFGNTIRGCLFGGSPDGGTTVRNTIDQFFPLSAGNTSDFGDLTAGANYPVGASNDTRGIRFCGYSGGYLNVIDYVTLAVQGNATDFGDASAQKNSLAGASSTTRGIIGGGYQPSGIINVIEYVTISSTGNTTDFGDLSAAKSGICAASSSTRMLFAGGKTPSMINVMEYVTMASTGDVTDFGDLTAAKGDQKLAASNKTLALFGGGRTPSAVATTNRVNIASTGDGASYGDILTAGGYNQSSSSTGHGGLA